MEMANEMTYTIKINRLDMCRLSTLCLSAQFEFEKEGPEHKGTAEMYKRLHEIIRDQLLAQDKANGIE